MSTGVLTLVDRWHWLIMCLAAPLLMFISPALSPLLLIVPALWIAAWSVHREALPRTPLNLTLLVLGSMVLVSTWATYDLAISLPKIGGAVLAFGIFFAVARESLEPKGWWLSVLLLLMAGLGIAAIGLLGTQWASKFTFADSFVSRLSVRITGIPGAEEGFNPNYMAGALLWIIPTCLMVTAWTASRFKDLVSHVGRVTSSILLLLVAGMTVFVTGVLMLSQSRGGYLAVALVVVVLLALVVPTRIRWILFGSLGLAAAFVALYDWGTMSGLASQALLGSGLTAAGDPTLETAQVRFEIWSRAIYAIQDFPITGMGMNTFRHVVQVLYPLFLISPDRDIGHAHNEFLQAAVDLGIPGLVAFISLYLVAFWMLGRTWLECGVLSSTLQNKRQRDASHFELSHLKSALGISPLVSAELTKAIVLGLGGGLFAHMVWGLTDAMPLGARPAFPFWILLGLVAGLHQQAEGILMETRRDADLER